MANVGVFNFTAKVLIVDSISFTIDTLNVSNGVFKNIPYTWQER